MYDVSKLRQPEQVSKAYQVFANPSEPEGWDIAARSSAVKYRNNFIGPMMFQDEAVQAAVKRGSDYDHHLQNIIDILKKNGRERNLGLDKFESQYTGTVMIGGTPITVTSDTIFVIDGQIFVQDIKSTKKGVEEKQPFLTQLTAQAVLAAGQIVGNEKIPSLDNTDLSKVVAGTLNSDPGKGNAIISRAYENAWKAVERRMSEGHSRTEAEKLAHEEVMGIYEGVIKQLVIDPARNYAQTGQNKISDDHPVTVSPHDVNDEANKHRVVSQVDNWKQIVKTIVSITGMQPEEFASYVGGQEVDRQRAERMSAGEFEKNKQWAHSVYEMAQKYVNQPDESPSLQELRQKSDSLIGKTRRFYKISEQDRIVRRYDPDKKEAQPGLEPVVTPSKAMGVVDTKSGEWRQIGSSNVYENGKKAIVVSGKEDALGYSIVAYEGRFDRHENGTMLLDGRILSGGELQLSEIGESVSQAFDQHGGGVAGEKQAGKAFRTAISSSQFDPNSPTAALKVRQANLVRLKTEEKGRRRAPQEVIADIMSGSEPMIWREGEEAAKAVPTLGALPWGMVQGKGWEATARLGREKLVKDSQRAMRDYVLKFKGRQFKSPMQSAYADAPEELTRLNTRFTNLIEYSMMAKGLARRLRNKDEVTSDISVRVPYEPSDNFTPFEDPKDVSFDYKRKRLAIGTDANGEKVYRDLQHWSGFSAESVETENIRGKHNLVIHGQAAFDPVRNQMKNWFNKAMSFSGDLLGLEKKGYEYLSVSDENPRTRVWNFNASYYGHEGGGPEGMRKDIMALFDDPETARMMVEWGAVKDPKTGAPVKDVDEARNIIQGEMIKTRPAPKDQRRYVSFDLETGGVPDREDPKQKKGDYSLREFGATVYDAAGNVLNRIDMRGIHDPDKQTDWNGLRHVYGKGMDDDKWSAWVAEQQELEKQGPSFDEAKATIESTLNGATVIGHNISNYDLPYLRERGIDLKDVEAIDTMALAGKLKDLKGKKYTGKLNLQDVSSYLFGDTTETHHAAEDEQLSHKVWREMIKRGVAQGPQEETQEDRFITGTSANIDNMLFFLGATKSKPFNTEETLEKPMTRARYEYLRGMGGRQVQDVNPDEHWGDDPNAMKPVKMTERGFSYANYGHQFTQAWSTGQGFLSLEELAAIANNQTMLSDKEHELVMKQVMPGIVSHGARGRVNSTAMLQAYLLNEGVDPGEIGVGNNIISFEEFGEHLNDFVLRNNLDTKRDFFKIISDPEFQKGVKDKFIRLPSEKGDAYIFPTDIMANIATYKPGEQISFVTNKPDYEHGEADAQSVRVLNLFSKAVANGGSVGYDETTHEIRSEIQKVATGKTTRAKAFGTETQGKLGREGVYAFDDELPMGTVIMGIDTLKSWFGTDDYGKAMQLMNSGDGPWAFLHRRPDPNSPMSGHAPARILPPSAAKHLDPAFDGMLVSGDYRDTFQGDSDGDRMHAMLMGFNRQFNEMFGNKGSYSPLERLSRGYSAILGEKVEFGSEKEYADFVTKLYQSNKGVNISEWAKRQETVGKSDWEHIPLSKEAFDKYSKETKLKDIIQKATLAEAVGHREMAEAYNVFVRRMEKHGEIMGVGDREHFGRMAYYTYQTGLDKMLYDKSTQNLFGMLQSYDVTQGQYSNFLSTDIGPVKPTTGVPMMGGAPRTAPVELISSLIGSEVLRGGGKNLKWLDDMAMGLTKDAKKQEQIKQYLMENISGADVYGEQGSATEKLQNVVAMQADINADLSDVVSRNKLARGLFKTVWGGNDHEFITQAGTVSGAFYSGALARLNKRDSGPALDMQNMMRDLAGDEEYEKLLAAGESESAIVGLFGDRGEGTAENIGTLRKHGTGGSFLGKLGSKLGPLAGYLLNAVGHADPNRPGDPEKPFHYDPLTGRLHTVTDNEKQNVIELVDKMKAVGPQMEHLANWFTNPPDVNLGQVAMRLSGLSGMSPQEGRSSVGKALGSDWSPTDTLASLPEQSRQAIHGLIGKQVHSFVSQAFEGGISPEVIQSNVESVSDLKSLKRLRENLQPVAAERQPVALPAQVVPPAPPQPPQPPVAQATPEPEPEKKPEADLGRTMVTRTKFDPKGNMVESKSFEEQLDPGSSMYGRMGWDPSKKFDVQGVGNVSLEDMLGLAKNDLPTAKAIFKRMVGRNVVMTDASGEKYEAGEALGNVLPGLMQKALSGKEMSVDELRKLRRFNMGGLEGFLGDLTTAGGGRTSDQFRELVGLGSKTIQRMDLGSMVAGGKLSAKEAQTLQRFSQSPDSASLYKLVEQLEGEGETDLAKQVSSTMFGARQDKLTKREKRESDAEQRRMARINRLEKQTRADIDKKIEGADFTDMAKFWGQEVDDAPKAGDIKAMAAETRQKKSAEFMGQVKEQGVTEQTLARGLELYGKTILSGSDLRGTFSEVRGLGKMMESVLTKGKYDETSIKSEAEKQAASSNITEVAKTAELFKSLNVPLEKVTKGFSRWQDLLERTSPGNLASYEAETGKGQNRQDRQDLADMMKTVKSIVGDGKDVEGNIRRFAQKTGLDEGAVKGMVSGVSGREDIVKGIVGEPTSLKKQLGSVASLISGDVEGMGWAMFNARRVWGMTGGQVQHDMGEYAKYAAGQQQSIMAMGGTQGYSGPVADVIAQQNMAKRFGLSVGKAGWDLFGGAARLLGGGEGIDVDRPSGATYLGTAATTIGGGLVTGGIINKLAGKLFGQTLTGAAGNLITNAATSSVGQAVGLPSVIAAAPAVLGAGGAAAAGVGIGAAISYDINRNGFLGTGIGKDPWAENKDFGTYLRTRAADLAAFTPDALLAQGGDEGARKRAMAAYDRSREAFGLAKEKSAAEVQYEQYSDWGKGLEKNVKTLSAGEGLQVGAFISKLTGISDGVLTSSTAVKELAEKIGKQGLTETTQQRVAFGAQLGRVAGKQYGTEEMAQYISRNAMEMSPGQMMRTEENMRRISPLTEMAQSMGIGLGTLTPDVLADMSPVQRTQLAKLGQGDQRTWSNLARQQLAGQGADQRAMRSLGIAPKGVDVEQMRQLITTEENGLQPLGTLTTTNFSQLARQVGLQGIGYTPQQAATMPLMSSANIEAQQRSTRDSYTQFQYQQQVGEFQRSNVYAQGGRIEVPQDYGGVKSYDFAGSFNLQAASQAESLRHGRQQLALQGGTLGGGFGWMGMGLTGLEGLSVPQLGGAGLNYRQALEAMELQKKSSAVSRQYQREDAQIAWDRGTTSLGWQREDLMTNFAHTMEQFQWTMKDLSTNFARGKQDFGFQQQSLNLQSNQANVNFGWQLEDLDTAMRYATGRERRQLAKQRERASVSFGFQEQSMNLQQEQLNVHEKRAEEDFAKETSRAEERERWAEDQFKKDKDRLDVRQKWLDEDLARALGRIGEQAKLEDEQMAKRRKDLEDELQLSKMRFVEDKRNMETTAGISAKQLEDSKKQFEIEQKYREDAIKAAHEHTMAMIRLGDASAALAAVQKAQIENFAYQVSNPEGPVASALRLFVANTIDAFSTQPSAGQYNKTIYGAFKEMIAKIVGDMKDPAAGSGVRLPIDYTGLGGR